jgi:hypothetical protein
MAILISYTDVSGERGDGFISWNAAAIINVQTYYLEVTTQLESTDRILTYSNEGRRGLQRRFNHNSN